MKFILLLLLLPTLLLFTSCQSEYAERMEMALELKKQYIDLNESCSDVKHPFQVQKCEEIKKQILLQAKISGNEKRFLSEVDMEN